MSDSKMSSKNTAYRRKTSEQRRQDLIEAGIRCLGMGGMSAFTIDNICKQAKVSRGLINHHFDTKDKLLLCIYSSMTDYLVRTEDTDLPRQQIERFIEKSFDESSFDVSALRAWLAIWGQVATNVELMQLHQSRYEKYKNSLVSAIDKIAGKRNLNVDAISIARRLIALIDGLWLEYCLHSDGFSLEVAKMDCYQSLNSNLGATIFRAKN